ncbi:MAG: hypothetical protein GC154_08510 [bacterium]|nr:hypothetical protein [bacterium]
MLSANLDEYAMRWPSGRPLEEDLGAWRVAYLKPRNEKALARECQQAGISYYLPLYVKRSRRRDNNKQRKSVMPLFPGYFPFVDRGDESQRLHQTNRVVHILDVSDQDAFVRDLAMVWRAAESGAKLEVTPGFVEGQRVRVQDGPLLGMTGVVESVYRDKPRLIINVEALNLAVKVEIDAESVEPVSD